MREKLNMSEDALERFLKADTFEGCKDILKATFPGQYPDIQFNQLPDEVNRHMVAVMKKNVRDTLYDPPEDPNWVFEK